MRLGAFAFVILPWRSVEVKSHSRMITVSAGPATSKRGLQLKLKLFPWTGCTEESEYWIRDDLNGYDENLAAAIHTQSAEACTLDNRFRVFKLI